MKTAVVLAGEKSGDLIGSEVCKFLTQNNYKVFGIGGEDMLKNGLQSSFFSIFDIAVMGFAEVVPKIFLIKKRINETVENILKINPSFVLTIDAPGFNTRVVRKLKKKHYKGKIYHAVAPTVWAYKEGRAKTFAKLYDELFCILPFEPKYFTKVGLKATFISYPPLKRLENEIEDAKNYKKEYFMLTLGSRKSEVLEHLSFAKQVVQIIKQALPDAKFCLPTFKEFEDIIKNAFPNEFVTSDSAEKLLCFKTAQFAISKSGTGAVEAAFFEIPSVVFYKVNVLSFLIIKLFVKIKFFNLINIVMQKQVIPEFIQFNATSKKVANGVLNLVNNSSKLKQQIDDIKKAKSYFNKTQYSSFGEGVCLQIIKNL